MYFNLSMIAAGFLAMSLTPAPGHDIYNGLRGKNSQLCCGNADCAATVYRLDHGRYYFMTRNDPQAGDAPASPAHEVEIPQDRITFLPIPGDTDYGDEQHHAHLCYRLAMPSDYLGNGVGVGGVFGNIYLYCAFVPPGAI